MHDECVIQKGVNVGASYLKGTIWNACDFPPELGR